MSPIFKRKKNRESEASQRAAEVTSAPVPQETWNSTSTEPDAGAEHRAAALKDLGLDAGPIVDAASAAPRSDLVSSAYAEWYADLAAVAVKEARPFSSVDSAVVDLTSPHPTGRANLYSGMPTLISSLVREESALKVARAHQANLRRRVSELTEQYGYAPVMLATGEVTWQEWPEEAWYSVGSSADHTGGNREAVAATSSPDSENTEPAADPAPDDPREGERDAASEAAITTESSNTHSPAGPDGTAGQHGEPMVHAMAPEKRVEPVLLRTVRLDPAGEDDAYVTLTAKCEVNPALVSALQEHGISAEDVTRLRTLAADWEREDDALRLVWDLGRNYLPGFSFEPRILLGSFVQPGQVLLADLAAMRPYVESSGVMAALAGDEATRKLSAAPLPEPDPYDRAPEAERGVGDRDVAELAAIETVASGRSVVIDTPPGSERVGTLAAMVADATASGRSVLYVPGRASSGKALINELDSLGLGSLVLDFADLDNVAMRLRTGLRQKARQTDDDAALRLRAKLTGTRKKLGSYIAALHTVDPHWDLSVYSIIERLAGLTAGPQAPQSRVRLNETTLEHVKAASADVQALLAEAADLGAFVPADQGGLWTGSRISTREQGEEALARAQRLANEVLPVVMAQSQRAAGETGLARAVTFDEWREQIDMLDGIAETLDTFLPQVYERSAADMVAATATREWRDAHGEHMKRSERRRLTKQAHDMVRPGANPGNLHEELQHVERQREVWRRYCAEGGWPKLPAGMAQIRATASEVSTEIAALEAVLPPDTALGAMPFEDLLAYVRQLAAGREAMGTLPRRNEVTAYLRQIGLGEFLDDLLARGVQPDAVNSELELVYLSSVFEQLIKGAPDLAEIGPADLSALSNNLRYLDVEHTRTLAWPVRRAVVQIMRETISRKRQDTMDVDAELEKYSTGALRDAIAKYPRIVQVARPVWAIPSMMVAEFIPPMPWADIVVMDEMDAVPLSAAISMLMRGRQVVVMGDVRRAEETAAIAQFAKVLPVRHLPTLRARYGDLATQTLREQGYADVIERVPSVKNADHARLVIVDGRGVPSPTTGTVDSTQVEVDAVVDAVINHALTQPEMSLAVVCVSEVHAARVREAINRTIEHSTVLGVLSDKSVPEPFMILDISQVGGLHRDSVILSVGYGKTVHGRVLHSFGSLSTPSGVTALVESVEAAREELTIISALGPGEIATENLTAPGPRLLAKIIDRAAGEDMGVEPARAYGTDEPLIKDLAARLEAAGWLTATNFGFESGVRIPLVVGHASFRGTWRVAVLYDDVAYVAEKSQRRRDRYWAERLEARGWIVFHTFSTSLFIDPQGQADAVIALLSQARDAILGEAEVALQPVAVPSVSDVRTEQHVRSASGGEPFTDPAPSMRMTRVRGPRPMITAGLPLAAYTDDQLDEIAAWIASDGALRSDDEMVLALREELNIHRRGAQVDAVLLNVVQRFRAQQPQDNAPVPQNLEERLTGEITAIRTQPNTGKAGDQ